MHPEIEQYQKDFIWNPEKMSEQECIAKKLPYIDKEGNIKNTFRFSESGNAYQKNGVYTNHPPQSDSWFTFWNRERKRVREGYWLGQVRITGYHYFFLNFHRMKIAVNGNETEGFAKFMRLQFFLFHLFDYADYTKQNFAFIKLRSCGASECAAAIGEVDCLVPPIRLEGSVKRKQMPSNAYFASDSDYLGGDDGIFTKMTRAMTWATQNTEGGLYEPFAINSSGKIMHWMVGERDNSNKPVQKGGEIIARVVREPDEARAGRKRRVFFEECQIVGSKVLMYDSTWKNIEDIVVGDFVMGIDSKPREVLKTVRNKGKLLSVYKQGELLLQVTPNHRLFFEDFNGKEVYISAHNYIKLSKNSKRFFNTKTNLYAVKFKNYKLNTRIRFIIEVKDEGIEDEYIGLTLDKDQLYITDNFIITHNSGANKNLGASMGVVESNLKRLADKTGIQIVWGTSNEKSEGIQAFKDVLQNPRGVYQTLAFRNVWRALEHGEQGFKDIPWNPFEYLLHPSEKELYAVGYFIPAYELKIRDEDGNPDRLAAYHNIIQERLKLQENSSSDQRGLLAFIADNPIFMEEALLVSKGKLFNHDGLAQQLVKLDTGMLKPTIHRGIFEFEKNNKNQVVGVRFWEDRTGNIFLAEIPSWAKREGNSWYVDILTERPWHQYIAGIDGIDQGVDDSSGKGSSLACVVKKRLTKEDGISDSFANTYVGLYNHRSNDARTDFENVLQMLLFFHAQALLEFSKIRIRDYIIEEKKCAKYLAIEPKAPGEKINKFRRNTARRGLRVTKDIIYFYIDLIKDYIQDYYQTFIFKILVSQLLDYTFEDKGKLDIVAAMGMCEVLNAELRDIPVMQNENKDALFPSGLGYYTDPITGVKKFGVCKQDLDLNPPKQKQVDYYDTRPDAEKTIIYID